MPEPTLGQAQRLLRQSLTALAAEDVPLHDATGRIMARSLQAPSPVPAFARSAMDGYVVRSIDLNPGKAPLSFTIAGEIAAGATILPRPAPGTAIRIMTGGALPPGANQVVPGEFCSLADGRLLVEQIPGQGAFMRRKGADLQKGRTIIRQGLEVTPAHLPLLAESGINTLPVVRRPLVGVLCTGSELLKPGAAPRPGQIIGGNRFLLDGLIRQAGATSLDLGLVADDLQAIAARLAEALAGPAQIILTTGGMGPGKYDLLPRAFTALGITPLYSALAVRPGRSTMFGLAGGKAVFALPGPPPAVFLLFHELILPALGRMQGLSPPLAPLVRAVLTEPLLLKKTGILNLKGGVVRLRGSVLSVRLARGVEPATAIIHVPAGRKQLRAGEKVWLRRVPGFLRS